MNYKSLLTICSLASLVCMSGCGQTADSPGGTTGEGLPAEQTSTATETDTSTSTVTDTSTATDTSTETSQPEEKKQEEAKKSKKKRKRT